MPDASATRPDATYTDYAFARKRMEDALMDVNTSVNLRDTASSVFSGCVDGVVVCTVVLLVWWTLDMLRKASQTSRAAARIRAERLVAAEERAHAARMQSELPPPHT